MPPLLWTSVANSFCAITQSLRRFIDIIHSSTTILQIFLYICEKYIYCYIVVGVFFVETVVRRLSYYSVLHYFVVEINNNYLPEPQVLKCNPSIVNN